MKRYILTPTVPLALMLLGSLLLMPTRLLAPALADDGEEAMPLVAVSDEGHGFVLQPCGDRFVPFGFNYDHDTEGELIEDYWHEAWKG